MRQIILDTETTGLEPEAGHRIIEIGAIEMIERRLTGRHFHEYINPEREVEAGALEVHGITSNFLEGKPRFAEIRDEFLDFIGGAELLIHNAPFDVGFLNAELARLVPLSKIEDVATVLDTLIMARQLHPGQRNSLDALCKRYEVDNSNRALHGARLDAEILAEVYLAMTGGQVDLMLELGGGTETGGGIETEVLDLSRLVVSRPSAKESAAHERRLETIQAAAGTCLWLQNVSDEGA